VGAVIGARPRRSGKQARRPAGLAGRRRRVVRRPVRPRGCRPRPAPDAACGASSRR
jgi:hypothetical protein